MDVSYIIAIWFLLLQCRLSLGCARDKYGMDCKETCSSGCVSGGCNSSTGECLGGSCKPGWRNTDSLQRCDQECPDGRYGDNCVSTCSPGCRVSPCDKKTGGCTDNRGYCKPGWRSESSYRCDRCSVGNYEDGQDCTQCGAGCNGGCDGTNGHCTCNTGWTGTRCNKCEDGYYMDRRDSYMDRRDCVECGAGCEPGTCNANNGVCTCVSGWKGPRCATRCRVGTYGPGCTGICNAGCKPGSCRHDTGDCNSQCKDGWTGPSCEQICLEGTYGRYCTRNCRPGCKQGSCNRVTGDCNSQCKDGWRGRRCEHKCGKGRYGPGCRKPCRRECLSCHHVKGSCAGNCTSGWHGENCTSRCRQGTYGQDCRYQCNEGCQPEKCDSIKGRCGTSCRSGWTGENCVDVCPPGTYGEHCRLNCSAGCVNQTCDRVDGTCDVCLPGWNMAKCDNKVLMQTSGSCLPPFVLWSSITTIVTVGAAVLRPAILV